MFGNMKYKHRLNRITKISAAIAAFVIAFPLTAAILPEDRFDALYHSYQGGGMDITGPSLMLRKLLGNSTSVLGKYYVDSISAASIDVITTASPYQEERNEYTLGVDYLQNKAILSFNYTDSEENDFLAQTFSFGVSQDFFGDLSTLSMGYSRGKDQIMRMTKIDGVKQLDPNFGTEHADRHKFRLGLAQILSKNIIASLNYELITDTGFLNNPYRQVRFADGSPSEFEEYPNTRSSNAVAFRIKYHLPYRAAISGEYRYFSDTWAIEASNYLVGYTHTIKDKWIIDLRYRSYKQSAASFYSDIFPSPNSQTYMARDKELSTFDNQTLGFSISYGLMQNGWKFIDRGSINFSYDYMTFDYHDFRDASATGYPLGQEPLYSFSSNVMQIYFSAWY